MARIRVGLIGGQWSSEWTGRVFDAERVPEERAFAGHWWTQDAIFLTSEVTVIASHRGEYNPDHPGELDPDWWDRQSYEIGAGRHLLHTGTE